MVAFTEGILHRMPRRELRGVIAHELSHIKHRDILVATVAAGLAGAVSLLANVFQWGALLGLGSSQDEEGAQPLGRPRLRPAGPHRRHPHPDRHLPLP